PARDCDLLKLPTFRASIVGGFLFRLGIGALPFLLPLLLQIGFHLTPFESGMITFTAAIGSIFMKTVAAIVLKRFGYRPVLIYNSLTSAVFLGACALFSLGVPFAVMIAILLAGGFFCSLQFTAVHTIAYAEIDPPLMSRATTLTSVAATKTRDGRPRPPPVFLSGRARAAPREPRLPAAAARRWRRAHRTRC